MSDQVEYAPDGMLVLKSPAVLPETIDLLVVGGGPAGTAAAFHAKELGLSVLVVDYDDLMKRIRDYAKGKPILPDYGGGDKMRFPKGGELVSLLHFSPIDKDDMVSSWRCYYRDSNVPAQIGIELLGLERQVDGVWCVKTWNHNTKSEQIYRARHVAIGIGRGVPRRFDIPGNTDGIAYRLTDPGAYVGEPVLVIGGGTSAAEAVIAVSNSKAKSGDSSAVHWSYRGDKLPKVSKALADVFFEASMGNGNIRYFPNSEPVAMVTAGNKQEYLSLRTDRKTLAGRPNETTHLEFLKQYCIACIGEDIPEAFLNSLGIFMAAGGPTNTKRMLVTQILETQQPNVYLIGDILSQAYLETDNFDGDPSAFREIKHRGNIKAALRDGVLVAKVVAQKVAGKKEFDVELDFVKERKQAEDKNFERAAVATIIAQSGLQKTFEPETKRLESKSYLVRILPTGVQEEEFQLKEFGVTTIGRKSCDIVFPEDNLLSERHASISHDKNGFSLIDEGSSTGIFLRVPDGGPTEVGDGDLLRTGRQFLLFSTRNGELSFAHYDQKGKQVDVHLLVAGRTIVVGREASDIVLDSKDMTLSRRHLSITVKEGKVIIKDLKSLNGSYLKLREVLRIEPGAQFRLGRQNLLLAFQDEKPPDKVRVSTHITSRPKLQAVPPVPKPMENISGGMSATFKNAGKTFSFEKGQTICDIAEKNGVEIDADCHAGGCGFDPVRVLSGGQNLNPVSPEELETLERIGLKPGECRLACMARPTGTIEVEIIK